MKSFIITVAIVVGAGFVYYAWRGKVNDATEALGGTSMLHAGDNESYPNKLKRYRQGADSALLAACTNAITGLRFVVKSRCVTYDDNFMKWTASATVEYINEVGGVQRREIQFKFDPSFSGQPTWFTVKK